MIISFMKGVYFVPACYICRAVPHPPYTGILFKMVKYTILYEAVITCAILYLHPQNSQPFSDLPFVLGVQKYTLYMNRIHNTKPCCIVFQYVCTHNSKRSTSSRSQRLSTTIATTATNTATPPRERLEGAADGRSAVLTFSHEALCDSSQSLRKAPP